MSFFLKLFLTNLYFFALAASKCPFIEGLVEDIPGVNFTAQAICLNTGYVKDNSQETFYWLFSTEMNIAQNKPLTIWFNSAQGTSSLVGIFLEGGPLELNIKDQQPQIGVKNLSWLNETNLLFFDYPSNTGFSSASSGRDQNDISREIRLLIEGLEGQYAQLFSNGVVLAGQGHAVHHITRLAVELEFIKIKGILLQNPLIDLLMQQNNIERLASDIGALESNHLKQVEVLQRNCIKSLVNDDLEANNDCQRPLDYVSMVSGNMSTSDIRTGSHHYQNLLSNIEQLFRNSKQTEQLYSNLGIQKVPMTFQLFNKQADEGSYFRRNEVKQTRHNIIRLLNKPTPIVIYTGQFNNELSQLGTEQLINTLDFQFNHLYSKQTRRFYFYKTDEVTSELGGYYKKLWPLHYMVARNVGKYVSLDNMRLSVQILSDIVKQSTIICHADDPGKCHGLEALCSKFMDNCNNNGICLRNGQCQCYPDFYGADCSIKPIDGQVTIIEGIKPQQWEYIKLNTSSFGNQLITFRGKNIEVMVNNNGLPSTHSNTFRAKGDTITIDAAMFHTQKVLLVAIHNSDFNNPTTIDVSYQTLGVDKLVQTKQGEIGVLLLILIIAVAILGLVNLLIFMRLKKVKSSHLKMYVN